ncbi:CIA30 family protein [Candidatus Aminicenantes bacterium AC-335-B20]|jgi:imidazolonepropionase-like amidohydrolase|nr:CIA30 family protein [Candidatus Aminicenantes bacterium AC-335-B20]
MGFKSTTKSNLSDSFVIKNVRIFDGEKVIPEGSVIIINGKINAVGKKIFIPESAQIIEGKGKTLLPGLIDSHVHIINTQALEQCLIFGVTTVIDMFMDVNLMKTIKEKQKSGQAQNMAYLISAGTLATAPGAHGTEYGINIPTLSKPEEASAFVKSRIAEGSDFIKIIYEEGKSSRSLKLSTVSALIKSAHKNGKIAVVHAATLKNCIDVIKSGANGLAHIYFNNAYNPHFGRLMAKHEAFIIPTLAVIEGMNGISDVQSLVKDTNISPYLTPKDIKFLTAKIAKELTSKEKKSKIEIIKKVIRQLKENHVPILAGTDAPNLTTTFGASLHHELELLVKAGLTPLEALKSATLLPAKEFGIKGRGAIKPGAIADLILVDGDPIKNIKVTRRIVAIWKEGKRVDREKYRLMVKKEWERIEELKKTPPPENLKSGLISDFDSDKIDSNFGAGWVISTDSVLGGKSKAEMKLTKGGVKGSRGSLLVKGEIIEGNFIKWAGIMFNPGQTIMAPANLSSKKAICFWAKGTPRKYAIMIFAQHLGFFPSIKTFQLGPEWKEYVFYFKDFNLEGYDIQGIFIGAYQETGEFWFQIDNVHLK